MTTWLRVNARLHRFGIFGRGHARLLPEVAGEIVDSGVAQPLETMQTEVVRGNRTMTYWISIPFGEFAREPAEGTVWRWNL